MFKMKGDEACINIFDLIHEYLPEERHQELAESLSCSDVVIDAVVDQILGGWTENGFCGASTSEVEPKTPLDIARRKIAKGANEASKNEIERLERSLAFMEKTKNEYMNKYFELYHMGYQPELP
jgi:hypothetical protein